MTKKLWGTKPSETERERAILQYVLAHGMDPTGSEMRSARELGRSFVAKPLSPTATKTELSRVPERFQRVWEFLNDDHTKALREVSPLLAATYRRLGEPGESVLEWWKNGARLAFAEKRVPAIFVDGNFLFEGSDGEQVEPGFAVMRVFMTKTTTELLAEFRRKLKDVHPGNKQIKSFRDNNSFGKQRVRPEYLKKVLDVWRMKTQAPHMSFAAIGDALKLHPAKKLIDLDDKKLISNKTLEFFHEADRLIRQWAGPEGRKTIGGTKQRKRGRKSS